MEIEIKIIIAIIVILFVIYVAKERYYNTHPEKAKAKADRWRSRHPQRQLTNEELDAIAHPSVGQRSIDEGFGGGL